MVKMNKNMIGAVVIAVIALAILLQGCTETAAPAPAAPAPAPAAPAPVMVSGLACSGSSIAGTVTNVIGEAVDVTSLRVLVNGQVIEPELLGCDKAALRPGDSTSCASLNGILPVSGENTVDVVMGSETGQASITC